MTALITSTQLTGLLIFGGVVCFVIVALFICTNKKTKYLDLIAELEDAVKTWHVTPENYKYIQSGIRELVRLDCDWKRTESLHNKFFWKYKAFFTGEIIKDEVKERVMI